MVNKNKKDNKNIEIGDLLNLKRSEKPSEEFWCQFEKELKEKTLKSIVTKKERTLAPRLKPLFVAFRNPALPLSAAALFVLTFFIASPSSTEPFMFAQDTGFASVDLSLVDFVVDKKGGADSFSQSLVVASNALSLGDSTNAHYVTDVLHVSDRIGGSVASVGI